MPLLLVAGCSGAPGANGDAAASDPAGAAAPAAPSKQAVEAATKALDAEKKIEMVTYEPNAPAQWEIAMVNDGSSRVGYAGYVCQVIQEAGAFTPGTKVKIIDAANLLVAGDKRNLRGMGTVLCDDFSTIDGGDLTPVR